MTGQMPQAPEEVTIYQTRQPIDQREKVLKTRLQQLSKIFDVRGSAVMQGERLVKKSKDKMLTLYPASDSFWFQHEELFANENKKWSSKLPDEKKAKERAMQLLKNNNLLLPEASLHGHSFTTVAVSSPKSGKIDEFNTEIHINFRYMLDRLPVFGPGAKTRVSFTDADTASGVYQFWRNPVPMKERRRFLQPDLALEILQKNFRFAQLKENSARVVIHRLEPGYFAMSPTAVQPYLLPVYKVQGRVSTEQFPVYDFTHFIIAVKYTDKDVKSMRTPIEDVKTMVI